MSELCTYSEENINILNIKCEFSEIYSSGDIIMYKMEQGVSWEM